MNYSLLSTLQPKVMDDGDMCMLCQSLVGIINVYRSEGYTKVSIHICTIYGVSYRNFDAI